MIDKIRKILNEADRETVLAILSELTDDYDLPTASSLIKKDCEPHLNKALLTEHQYSEGNEEAGYLDLSVVLGFVEEILNCDEREYGDVEFQYFVRPETEEEIKEQGHDDGVIWFTEDEGVAIKDLLIQFEMS